MRCGRPCEGVGGDPGGPLTAEAGAARVCAARGAAPELSRCASPSPDAVPGDEPRPEPGRLTPGPWLMRRRTVGGVVSLLAVPGSEPISATSFMRCTRTGVDFIVPANRPGTWVFSLGGGPDTRRKPRGGRSASAGADMDGSAGTVGTHQRGGRDTGSTLRTRSSPGASTWRRIVSLRRTATGRATLEAKTRADSATVPTREWRDGMRGRNRSVAARPRRDAAPPWAASFTVSMATSPASRYGIPHERFRVLRTGCRCSSR